jgi:hypothetical protein
MLSGLPVISCRSRGGRDVFYREFNSVILEEDSKECVREAVLRVKIGIENGFYDRYKIRAFHMDLGNEMIRRLSSFVLSCCKIQTHEVSIAEDFIKDMLDKRINYAPRENVMAELAAFKS